MTKVRIVQTSRDGWVLKWKIDGADRQRRCRGKTQRSRETERKTLENEINSVTSDLSWSDFWSEINRDHLSYRSPSYAAKCKMMHRRLQRVIGRKNLRCKEIDRPAILKVQAEMARSTVEPATVQSNMATLWAIVAWGQDHGFIPEFARPRRRRGKREKQVSKSKGRSLSSGEIQRLVAAIPGCVKEFEPLEPFVTAVWVMLHTGMRLTEAWDFAWEPGPNRHYLIDLDTYSASIEFADCQKSGISSVVPLTNGAIAYFRSIDPRGEWVCRTSGARGPHKTPDRLGRVIAAAGRAAGIVVKTFEKPEGVKHKYASAHDLRRTFATNLQRDLTLTERRTLTRHADIQTLLNHYEDAPTPVLIAKLRGG